MAVERRELRGGLQADRAVFFEGLEAEVEIRRNAPEVDRAAGAPEQAS